MFEVDVKVVVQEYIEKNGLTYAAANKDIKRCLWHRRQVAADVALS